MKLYKNTLTVSVVACVIAFAVSAIIRACGKGNGLWSNYAENIFVGVACSLIVVIITTFLQYKAEQKRVLNKLTANIYNLIFRYDEIRGLVISGSMRDEIAIDRCKKMEGILLEVCKCCAELTYYSNRKKMYLKQIFDAALNIKRDIASYKRFLPNDMIKEILKNKYFRVCVDGILCLYPETGLRDKLCSLADKMKDN